MNFESLGLEADLLRAIDEQGYTEPTAIQLQAIPLVLEGRDVMAAAQTGTGKTAGFTLPLLQRLGELESSGNNKCVRALVMVPTRELATQVHESIKTYGKFLQYRSCVLFGGVSINPQIQNLRRGVDIVIATPGRLLDHLQRGTINLAHLDILVLDEADRMLDMGFIHDIRRIIKHLPEKENRQSLMFSATFSTEIRQLAKQFLVQPEHVEAERRNSTVEVIEQQVYRVDKSRKRELLSHLIGDGYWKQVLVFTRTKHGANRLARQLESDGLSATAIHGNKSQAARTKALAQFKAGKVRVLVATDIAARGLDIDQLPHVVNFDLPNVSEDYVHRIGRTGRAGNEGSAVSLVSPDENGLLRDIEKLIGKQISSSELEGYEVTTQAQEGARKNHRNARPGNSSGRPNGGNSANRRNGGPRRAGKGKQGNGGARAQNANGNQPQSRKPRRNQRAKAAPKAGYSTVADRLF